MTSTNAKSQTKLLFHSIFGQKGNPKSGEDFYYDAGEKMYFDDPPGSGSSDVCNPDKNSKFTGYTSGGEFCKRSSGVEH